MTSPAQATQPTRSAAAVAPGLMIAAIMLVALNLRAPLTSVPPVLLEIADDLHLGGAAAGLLTTLPALCMGVFAPVGQRLARAIGRESTVGWALGLVTVGTVLRLGGGSTPVLYGATLVLGIGIAIVGTVLPGVIKEHFAARSGMVTTLFSAGMAIGAAVASQLTVPLARLLASWEAGLATWGALSLLGLVCWLAVTATTRQRPRGASAPGTGGLPWRSTTAWLLTVYLLGNGWQFFAVISWVPATFERLGRDPGSAASLLTMFSLAQAAAGLALPLLVDRVRDLRALIGPAGIITVLGALGLTLWPQAAPVLWVVVLGVGLGSGFTLLLVLLVVYAATPSASARLTAMVFLVSYPLSALGPMVFGWVADLSGGMRASWGLVLLVAVVQLSLVVQMSPRRRQVD